jgi:hypothetical protein
MFEIVRCNIRVNPAKLAQSLTEPEFGLCRLIVILVASPVDPVGDLKVLVWSLELVEKRGRCPEMAKCFANQGSTQNWSFGCRVAYKIEQLWEN